VGKTAMKPLLLSDVANALHIHESTVSRVTTQKYMSTPRGLFELKYFFSKKIATIDKKGSCAESVRALLSKLIAEENTLKPLSDDKIVKLMDQLGITIARRTIAKYREVMGIPSAARRISVRDN
jgi:RNA polymerase sigma-54 factor